MKTVGLNGFNHLNAIETDAHRKEKYKEWFVAKGYSQIMGLTYRETCATAAQEKLILQQTDVETAYYGYLKGATERSMFQTKLSVQA